MAAITSKQLREVWKNSEPELPFKAWLRSWASQSTGPVKGYPGCYCPEDTLKDACHALLERKK